MVPVTEVVQYMEYFFAVSRCIFCARKHMISNYNMQFGIDICLLLNKLFKNLTKIPEMKPLDDCIFIVRHLVGYVVAYEVAL